MLDAVVNSTTVHSKVLPDFVVIGGAKCGTNWLNECLREHPDVYLTPDVHEIFYFDRYFDRGLDWYKRYFRGVRGHKRIGEVSPTYLAHPLAPERLRRVLPGALLIVCLRDPVDRAWSMYLHRWRKGDLGRNQTLREACRTAPEIIEGGRYAYCLRRWREFFPSKSFRFLVLEDARTDAIAYLRRAYKMLGIDPDFRATALITPTNVHQSPRSLTLAKTAFGASRFLHHCGLHRAVELGKSLGLKRWVLKDGRDARTDPPPMSADDRNWLKDQYFEDVAQISNLNGRDLGRVWWGTTG